MHDEAVGVPVVAEDLLPELGAFVGHVFLEFLASHTVGGREGFEEVVGDAPLRLGHVLRFHEEDGEV